MYLRWWLDFFKGTLAGNFDFFFLIKETYHWSLIYILNSFRIKNPFRWDIQILSTFSVFFKKAEYTIVALKQWWNNNFFLRCLGSCCSHILFFREVSHGRLQQAVEAKMLFVFLGAFVKYGDKTPLLFTSIETVRVCWIRKVTLKGLFSEN